MKSRTQPLLVLALVVALAGGYGTNAASQQKPEGVPTQELLRVLGQGHLNPLRPTRGREEQGEPLGAPAGVADRSNSYRFGRENSPGRPVTWSPCRPIHYVARLDNAPPGSKELLADVVGQLSRATGLVFIDDGPTKEKPSQNRPAYLPALYGDRWAPVLIAWATHAEVPHLAGRSAGIASPHFEVAGGELTYVSGFVYLDAPVIADLRKNPKKAYFHKVALLHELAHIVGLGHVDDPRQVMAPRGRTDLDRYQAGDLTGLARLGRGPCRPGV